MRTLIIIVILFVHVFCVEAEVRTWRSRSGKSIEAEYVGMLRDKIILKTTSGVEKRIPIDAFSKSDREYIQNLKPPRLKLDLDKGLRRKSNSSRYTEEFQFEITVTEEFAQSYTKALNLEFFIIGKVAAYNSYVLLDKKNDTFYIEGRTGKEHRFRGRRVSNDYNEYSPVFNNYIIILSTENGHIIDVKGKEGYKKYLHIFRESEVGQAYFDDFQKKDRYWN